jgi:ParB family chromosome partitioning protein
MPVKKRGGLGGRRLGHLLSEVQVTRPVSDEPVEKQGTLQELPLDRLERGKFQPRRDFDEQLLEELAASIRTQGVMQPIVVRSRDRSETKNRHYEIIAGERRWRAAQQAGLKTIPAIIREVEDEAVLALSLIENIQRENLNPVEEAVALGRLQEEFGLTQQQVAEAGGKSRSTIANLLRLLALQADVRRMLEHGDLEMGHARALLALPEKDQLQAARQVTAQGLSVRQTEQLVRCLLERPGQVQTPKKPVQQDVLRLERRLAESLGAPVKIRHNAQGKGRLEITYNSLEELDGVLQHIQGEVID